MRPSIQCHLLRLAAPAAVAALVVGCADRRLTADECTEMLDRYIDMTIAADPGLASLPEGAAATAKEMKRAVKKAEKSYRRVHDQCEAEVRRHEYKCAMGAKSPGDWEACID